VQERPPQCEENENDDEDGEGCDDDRRDETREHDDNRFTDHARKRGEAARESLGDGYERTGQASKLRLHAISLQGEVEGTTSALCGARRG
jgi:hypothetical protein